MVKKVVCTCFNSSFVFNLLWLNCNKLVLICGYGYAVMTVKTMKMTQQVAEFWWLFYFGFPLPY